MARWSQQTLLPPDLWAKFAGVDPCQWNGVNAGDSRGCALWYQEPWHSDPMRAGRETVGQAVRTAEAKMAARLGFYVAPRYVQDELIRWPRNGSVMGLKNGYVVAVGVEARTELETGATVTYSGAEGDSTGTVSVTVPAGLDPCEIAAYYPGVILAEIKDADETWRLHPQSVTVSGTMATLVFLRCQLVEWEKHAAGEIVDIDDDTAFLETIDVYRRYTDPRGAEAVWPDDCATGGCGEVTQSMCSYIEHQRLSHIGLLPAAYDETAGTWQVATFTYCARPRHARVSYLSGWRDPALKDCQRWGDLGEVVVKLSLVNLREAPCLCDKLTWLWEDARRDMELPTAAVLGAYSTFGSKKAGSLDAWLWCQDHKITHGGAL